MFVKITNGTVDQYPYSVGQLRRDNPNTSFPKNIPNPILESYGVFAVTIAGATDYDPKTQKITRSSTPVLVDGNWTITKTVVALSDDEVTVYNNRIAAENREERDRRLAVTDWWASSDLTMTAEQTTYRQALRDITSHANWPHLAADDWPTKP
jgi:hypothetical protein